MGPKNKKESDSRSVEGSRTDEKASVRSEETPFSEKVLNVSVDRREDKREDQRTERIAHPDRSMRKSSVIV